MFPILLPPAFSIQDTRPDGCWVRCDFMSYKTRTDYCVLRPTGLLQNSSRSFLQSHTEVCSQHLFFSPMRGNKSYLASHADILHYKHCNYRFRSISQPVKSTSRAKCTLLLRWPPEPRQLNCTLEKPISLQ